MIVQILVLHLLYLLVGLVVLDMHYSTLTVRNPIHMVLKKQKKGNNHIYYHSLRRIYSYYYFLLGTNYTTKILHIENIVYCIVDLEA
jgi:hypothetical protein